MPARLTGWMDGGGGGGLAMGQQRSNELNVKQPSSTGELAILMPPESCMVNGHGILPDRHLLSYNMGLLSSIPVHELA